MNIKDIENELPDWMLEPVFVSTEDESAWNAEAWAEDFKSLAKNNPAYEDDYNSFLKYDDISEWWKIEGNDPKGFGYTIKLIPSIAGEIMSNINNFNRVKSNNLKASARPDIVDVYTTESNNNACELVFQLEGGDVEAAGVGPEDYVEYVEEDFAYIVLKNMPGRALEDVYYDSDGQTVTVKFVNELGSIYGD